MAFTVAVTVASLWILGAFDWIAEWAGCEWAWLKSPIGLGAK